MKLKHSIFFMIFGSICFANDTGGYVTSIDIVSHPISCFDYKTGVNSCYFVRCNVLDAARAAAGDFTGCDHIFNPISSNYVPELVVQVYDNGKAEPWLLSKSINAGLGKSQNGLYEKGLWLAASLANSNIDSNQKSGEGSAASVSQGARQGNLKYNFVDAYGSPSKKLSDEAIKKIKDNPPKINLSSVTPPGISIVSYGPTACGGISEPFKPYFISNANTMQWRFALTEQFDFRSLWVIPGKEYNLFASGMDYGPIYPRHGFSIHSDPLRSAALKAFRAVHIITRKSQAYSYVELWKDPVKHEHIGNDTPVWKQPEPLDHKSGPTGKWQMIYPYKDDDCVTFPYGLTEESKYRGDIDDESGYIWQFWREYVCCRDVKPKRKCFVVCWDTEYVHLVSGI